MTGPADQEGVPGARPSPPVGVRMKSPAVRAIESLTRQIAARHRTLRLRLFQAGTPSHWDFITQEPDFPWPRDAGRLFSEGLDRWRVCRDGHTQLSAIDFAVSSAGAELDGWFANRTPPAMHGGHRTTPLGEIDRDTTVARHLAEAQLAPGDEGEPLDAWILANGAASPVPYLAPEDAPPTMGEYVAQRNRNALAAFLAELPAILTEADLRLWQDRQDTALEALAARHGITPSAMHYREQRVVALVDAAHVRRFGAPLPPELRRRRRHPTEIAGSASAHK